jgi:hypothetical protein
MPVSIENTTTQVFMVVPTVKGSPPNMISLRIQDKVGKSKQTINLGHSLTI